MKLHVYKNCESPQVTDSVDSTQWFEFIRTGQHSCFDQIRTARSICDTKEIYDELKRTSISAVTFNFNFQKRKNNKNISGPTGLMFFEVDEPSFQITSLDPNKVHCCYRSLSGRGLHIIVRVSGLTPSNFDSTYDSISQQLGIKHIICSGSRKMSQFSVMSYDPCLFHNPDSFIFSPTTLTGVGENNKVSFSLSYREQIHIGLNDTFFKYSDIETICEPEQVVEERQGIRVVSCFLPEFIKMGERTRSLFNYCLRLVHCNPDKTLEQVFYHLAKTNEKRCEVPLPEKEVRTIVQIIFKYKQEGTLNPKGTQRKIIFGKKTGMNIKEKQSYSAKVVGQWRTEKTRERIKEALRSNPGGTQKEVARQTGMSLITIKRHWSDLTPSKKNDIIQPKTKCMEEQERIKLIQQATKTISDKDFFKTKIGELPYDREIKKMIYKQCLNIWKKNATDPEGILEDAKEIILFPNSSRELNMSGRIIRQKQVELPQRSPNNYDKQLAHMKKIGMPVKEKKIEEENGTCKVSQSKF